MKDISNVLDIKSNGELVSPYPAPTTTRKQTAEQDTEYARGNIRDLTELGSHAVDELFEIAKQSQHPRTYEVLAKLIQTVAETNKQLIDTHGAVEKKNEEKASTTNNLYVGSTADLLKVIKQSQES